MFNLPHQTWLESRGTITLLRLGRFSVLVHTKLLALFGVARNLK